MKKIIQTPLVIATCAMLIVSCKKDDPAPAPTTLKQWTIPLSAKYENPAPAGRSETGTAEIQLLSDNSLKYTITVTGLASGDALTAAHIHTGDIITSGPVVQGFEPTFSGSTASGTLTNLRQSFIDSLQKDEDDLYFNVHSTQVPGGLLRGQLNEDIDFAQDVVLSGNNETPVVATTATGIALLRLSSKKLYSKVTVTNLEAGDALKIAHIHSAPSGVNGPVIIDLCGSAADFGVSKMVVLTDALAASVKNDAIYVNAHSNNHPAGLVRGQVR